jgi:hypothetical protein
MYELLFKHPAGIALVRVDGKNLMFSSMKGSYFSLEPFSNIRIDVSGAIKEFPDLANLPAEEIRTKARERFLECINKMNTEKEVAQYVIKDLANHGYVLIKVQRPGFREASKI